MFEGLKESIRKSIEKSCDDMVDFSTKKWNCKHCKHYNLILDTGDVLVDECLKNPRYFETMRHSPCKHYRQKKERKTNYFGVDI